MSFKSLKGDKNELGPEESVDAEEDSDIEEGDEEGDEDEDEEEEDDDNDDDDEAEEEEEDAKEQKVDKRNKSKKRKHSDVDEDDDDDDEGEWVDVSADEGEEGDETAAKTSKLTLAEKEQLASKVSTERIFTQEDFKRIRIEQLKKKISDKNFNKAGKEKGSKTITIDSDASEDEDKKLKR